MLKRRLLANLRGNLGLTISQGRATLCEFDAGIFLLSLSLDIMTPGMYHSHFSDSCLDPKNGLI